MDTVVRPVMRWLVPGSTTASKDATTEATAASGSGSTSSAAPYFRPVKELSADEVESALESVSSKCQEWHDLSPAHKIEILKDMKARIVRCSLQLGISIAKTNGFGNDTTAPPSNVVSTFTITNAAIMSKALTSTIALLQKQQDLAAANSSGSEGAPPPTPPVLRSPTPLRFTPDGRAVIPVIDAANPPADPMLKGKTAELYVRTQDGSTLVQGTEWKESHAKAVAGVSLVLGAGNQVFLGFTDLLYCMFQGNSTVCFKHHDAMALAAPFVDYIVEPLTTRGFLATFHCDIPATVLASQSPLINHLHITGSTKAHDALLWGTGEEAEKRRAAADPLVKVPFTSELGNVTPVFVTPCEYSEAEITRVAQLVALNTINNAGCNCLAPKAVIIAADWPQADAFEAALKEAFGKSGPKPLWYPGSQERYDAFIEQHPGCALVEPDNSKPVPTSKPVVPWAIHTVTLPDTAAAAEVPGLKEEFFAPVLTIVRLGLPAPDASDAPDAAAADTSTPDSTTSIALAKAYLAAIPGFAAGALWGDLVAVLCLPPAVSEAAPEAVDTCLDALPYGSVTVNAMSFIPYVIEDGAWGGLQRVDTSPSNPGSGVGKILNNLLYEGVEKVVIKGAWDEKQQPETIPLPTYVAKGLAGLIANGPRGVLQAMTS